MCVCLSVGRSVGQACLCVSVYVCIYLCAGTCGLSGVRYQRMTKVGPLSHAEDSVPRYEVSHWVWSWLVSLSPSNPLVSAPTMPHVAFYEDSGILSHVLKLHSKSSLHCCHRRDEWWERNGHTFVPFPESWQTLRGVFLVGFSVCSLSGIRPEWVLETGRCTHCLSHSGVCVLCWEWSLKNTLELNIAAPRELPPTKTHLPRPPRFGFSLHLT